MLEIDGNPGGAVYLDKGHITFARASWSPNLMARLRAVLPPVAEVRGMLAAGDRPDRDLGARLVTRGYLTADQLHAILRSIVIDAVMVLTVPLAEEASIAGLRFEPAKTHWAESLCRLPVHLVRTEAAGRAERMKRLDIADTTRLELRDLASSPSVLGPEQWTIVGEMTRSSSARDLAWRCGFALSDTVEQLAGLVSAGLCAPCPPEQQAGQKKGSGRRQQAVMVASDPPSRTAGSRQGPAVRPSARQVAENAVMPFRRPGAAVAGPHGEPPGDSATVRSARPGDGPLAPLPPESLMRVLDGLRKLS